MFAEYARAHDLAFIDVARLMPFDPDLFIDAIHNSYAGERLRAWVFLQGLVPIVERHLKSGAWPRKIEASKERARCLQAAAHHLHLHRQVLDARALSEGVDRMKGGDAGAAPPDAPAAPTTLVDDRGAELPTSTPASTITADVGFMN